MRITGIDHLFALGDLPDKTGPKIDTDIPYHLGVQSYSRLKHQLATGVVGHVDSADICVHHTAHFSNNNV